MNVRRGIVIGVIAEALAALLTGCGILTPPRPDVPVPPQILGPIRPAPDGGLPIECRGVPAERCLEVGSGIPADARAIRIIVTCEIAVCSEAAAAIRLDAVNGAGVTTNVGRGTWGNAEQP